MGRFVSMFMQAFRKTNFNLLSVGSFIKSFFLKTNQIEK